MVTNLTSPSLIPIALAFMGLQFFLYSFQEKTWPPPLISFILLLAASITAITSQYDFCINGACDTYKTITPELTYLFGGLSLLALLLLFLRVLNAWGDKDAPEVQI